MSSLIESITANLSKATFFGELCFAGQKFEVAGVGEFELADVFIWLESQGIIIQVKERAKDQVTDQSAFDKWFKKKVLGKGSNQIADTLAFFKKYPSVTVQNARGIEFELSQLDSATMHKLILFGTLHDGVDQHHMLKLHESQRSGFIHLIQAVDFANLLEWIISPKEMLEYLSLRASFLQKAKRASKESEKWLFGQFIQCADPGDAGLADGEAVVDRLVDDSKEVDLRPFLDMLGDWAISQIGNPRHFQKVILECALLPRSGMREFKLRIVKCLERLDRPGPETLYRIVNAPRDCAFVFGAMPPEYVNKVEVGAQNLTVLAKYDCRTSKAVGFFLTKVDQESLATTPVYLEGPWEQNDLLDRALRTFNPFIPLNQGVRYGYFVRGEEG